MIKSVARQKKQPAFPHLNDVGFLWRTAVQNNFRKHHDLLSFINFSVLHYIFLPVPLLSCVPCFHYASCHRLSQAYFTPERRAEVSRPLNRESPERFSDPFSGANSHFPRPAGPHFPASQGHIKRSALEIGRARGAPPC